jgi:hypothetical protein
VFFNTVLGNYAACLLISNIINSIAGVMGLKQLMSGGIQEGSYCTIQGEFILPAAALASN